MGNPSRIRIGTTFPDEGRGHLRIVGDSAYWAVRERFGSAPPWGDKPVLVEVPSDGVPRTCPDISRPEYLVWVQPDDQNWSPFAYQLAHELGHIWFDPRRGSPPVEVMATALALQVLDDIGEAWAQTPPGEGWNDYACCFPKRRLMNEDLEVKKLPRSVQYAVKTSDWAVVADYFGANYAGCSGNGLPDQGRMLGALALRSGPIRWPCLCGVAGLTTPSPDECPCWRDDLPLDPSKASPHVRGLLQRLGMPVA